MSLDDKKNILKVYLRDIDEDKIGWFTKTVCDKPYLAFEALAYEPIDQVNYSGQGISAGTAQFSGAFRVKRQTDAGTKYGFITCGHGNSLLQTINGADGSAIGSVQLRQYSGSIDASYVQMSNSTNFSNVIHGSPYTLNYSNDDLYYPTVGQSAWIHARVHLDDPGIVQSTNVSYSINGATFSGLYSANYPSSNGDSGGLICSSPVNYACDPLGVNKGRYNGNAVFTGAIKIINKWYFVRY